MIDELGWVTLEQRRTRNRLIQLYKIINGYTPGALPAANTTNYQASFFYLTVKDWNDLPLSFYSIPTSNIFTNSINAHT